MALLGKKPQRIVPLRDLESDPTSPAYIPPTHAKAPEVEPTPPPAPGGKKLGKTKVAKGEASPKPAKVKKAKKEKPKKVPSTKVELDVVGSQPSRRSHRAAFPTPGFKLFTLLLNLLSVPMALVFLRQDLNYSNLVFLLLAVVGVNMAIYVNVVKPLPTNLQHRKVISALAAAYGFLVLAASGLAFIL